MGQGRFPLLCIGTRPTFQVIFKLLAKFVDERNGGHGRRVTQRAEGTAQHVLRQIANVVDVFGDSTAGMETGQRLLQPVRSFTTRDAPTAAFVLIKLDGSQSKLDNAI